MPVKNRKRIADDAPCAKTATAAFRSAPAPAERAKSREAGMRSARFSEALNSAPATKPICTLIVIHDCSLPLRPHSAVSCGTTADPENHSAIASSVASASNPSVRAFCANGSAVDPETRSAASASRLETDMGKAHKQGENSERPPPPFPTDEGPEGRTRYTRCLSRNHCLAERRPRLQSRPFSHAPLPHALPSPKTSSSYRARRPAGRGRRRRRRWPRAQDPPR